MILAAKSSPSVEPKTDAEWISWYAAYVKSNRLVLLDCCSQSATRRARYEFRKRLLDGPPLQEPQETLTTEKLSLMEIDDDPSSSQEDHILLDSRSTHEESPERVLVLRVSTSPSPPPPPILPKSYDNQSLTNNHIPEEPIIAVTEFPESQQIDVSYDDLSDETPVLSLLQPIPEEDSSMQENEDPTSQAFFPSKIPIETPSTTTKAPLLLLSSQKHSPPRGLLQMLEKSVDDETDSAIAKELQEIKEFVQRDTDLFGFL